MDKRCADIAFKDLQARISKRCVEREVNPVDVPNEELNNKKTEGGNTGERIVRRIERVRALPSTPQSLAEVLEDLSTESSFCEGRVRDYVVDHRTIDYYQNFGIPSNRPIMVFAKKITRENQKIVDRTHELIFADCRYNAMQQPDIGDCLQYRIRDYKTREYLKDIFEQKKLNGCYLVFLCAWRKDLINPNTYIAVGETPGCIGYIKIDKCQIPFVDR